jgi:hypothetical protein
MTTTETFDVTLACKAQKKHCDNTGDPHFAPPDGGCYRCSRNIYKQIDRGSYKTGISVERATKGVITGCPHCNYSFCD